MLILGRSHLIWPKPVVRRWKPSSILVPGVSWRWVPWGQAVQNYVSTHYNPVENCPMLYFVSFVYVPDLTKLCSHQLSCADLVVVGLWVILGCSWFDSTTTSACRDWTAPIWRKINFAIGLLSFVKKNDINLMKKILCIVEVDCSPPHPSLHPASVSASSPVVKPAQDQRAVLKHLWSIIIVKATSVRRKRKEHKQGGLQTTT